ncbi:NADP-dependent 3-hydroxy acid dehydrogenase YdfG [Amycolatopsis xylanica]|uniref:NADP-dependent 3-hydroxy acid dehydrogenase YdfG n=1 Tax=Amycolatopsis xylanica TaxID=589385 RepID=A0A1H3QUB1_9PSEU|nr:SDR family oxidoreductase [Amycolatopsis xylanica]SDZ16299.1 NADP-dependent 3-hydroxy acid dehydrogenase YdfG [Amycolatopsis xylanica]
MGRLLEGKTAIVYGAGGPIGGAVATAFARDGAQVFLAGRTKSKLDALAQKIGAAVTELDALDQLAVTTFVDSVVARTGRVDISVNVISYGDVQKPLAELTVEEFLQPITTAMRTHFLTTSAAARHMVAQGSGVVLAFGGSGPQTVPGLGGFKVALDALEGLRRQFAAELGPHGIRVVTLKTGGVPESIPESFGERGEIESMIRGSTLLGKAATLADVGNVASFVASDQARTMTSSAVNISCGAIVDI